MYTGSREIGEGYVFMTCEEGLLMEPVRPRKTVTVEKVSNGFIVTARSSKNPSERLSIAKNLKEANKMAAKFLGK
jgi:hypothetical protein